MKLLVPLVLLLALALRLIPLPLTFTEHGLLPGYLADEYYHLRRIVYSALHFPDVLWFDPYVSFPDGGRIHWPPGFDWTIAALAWLVGGGESRKTTEIVAAWVPTLLGLLTVGAAMAVARSTFGRTAAVVAGLLVAVLPPGFVFSRVGLVDHHVAVMLAGALLLGAGMAWLRSDARRPGAGHAAALGFAMGAPLLVWPGFLLHIGLTQLALVVATLGAADRADAVGRARSLAGAHAVAAALVLPFCLGPPFEQYGAWSPLVLSRFQPAWLAGGAVCLAAVSVLWGRLPVGTARPGRIAAAISLAVLGVGVVLATAPGLREALLYASGWFTQSDEARTVIELGPLSFSDAASHYTLAFFLFPLALALVAERAYRAKRSDLGLLLLWAGAFLCLTLLQRRFNDSLLVPYAIVWGGVAGHLKPIGWRHIAGRPLRIASSALVATLLLLLIGLFTMNFYAAWLAKSSRALTSDAPILSLVAPYPRVHLGAAAWLKRSTPPTRGYLNPSERPEYGVLTSWGVGHLVRYVAERPLVQDNFGLYGGRETFEKAWRYYGLTSEEEAVELLDELGVRYVVATRRGAGQTEEDYPPTTMAYRLAGAYGSAEDASSGEATGIPALAHHRLVYHARSKPGAPLRVDSPHTDVTVFEKVMGARVAGKAEPGSLVEARLRLLTSGGRRLLPRASDIHVYRTVAKADATGRWALTLPYSTDIRFSDAVRAVGPYQLAAGSQVAKLEVPESAVQKGEAIAGPRLAAPPLAVAPAGAEEPEL